MRSTSGDPYLWTMFLNILLESDQSSTVFPLDPASEKKELKTLNFKTPPPK
jgi:hypothetical protein